MPSKTQRYAHSVTDSDARPLNVPASKARIGEAARVQKIEMVAVW